MKHAKMLAILAVAVFCVSAFAIAIDVDNSSADGEKQTYSFYLELNDGTHRYNARLPDAVVDGAAPSASLYSDALVAACTAAGITAVSSAGSITSITTTEATYPAFNGVWQSDNYWDYGVYYNNNGSWKLADGEDFDKNTMYVIVYDKYAFSEPSDASKYYKQDAWGPPYYWVLLPTVEMVEYKIFFDLKDGDHSYSKWVTSKQLGISGNSLKSARVLGAKEAGFTVENGKYASGVSSVTADDYKYVSHGEYKGADYWNFAAYCQNGDKNEWKDLQADDLTTATIISHVFNKYAFEDPKDDTYYYHEPTGTMEAYWTKSPSVLPNGDSPDKGGNNNLVLYIAIGAVAVVAVAAIVFFVVKKKP